MVNMINMVNASTHRHDPCEGCGTCVICGPATCSAYPDHRHRVLVVRPGGDERGELSPALPQVAIEAQPIQELGKSYWVREDGGNWFIAQWTVRGWSTGNLFFDVGGYDIVQFARIPDPPEICQLDRSASI